MTEENLNESTIKTKNVLIQYTKSKILINHQNETPLKYKVKKLNDLFKRRR